MSKRDYYEILEIKRTATEQEIKSAYRRLAVRYHPDKNPGDHSAEEKFKEAAEAYSVLSDAEQRARYDRFGHAGVSSSTGANWGAQGFGGIEDILSDLFGFGDVFGGRGGAAAGGPRAAPQRGAHPPPRLGTKPAAAPPGATPQIRTPHPLPSQSCTGTGAEAGS